MDIREGIGAYTMGYPVGWMSASRDWPVVRFRCIAQIQPYLQDGAATFLMDGSVFDGNSGGPVFTFHAMQRGQSGGRYPHLVGMVASSACTREGENAGLGIVVPVELINETVDAALATRLSPRE